MAFDQGLIDLYTTSFSTNLELLLQQMGSKLRDKVSSAAYKGKMASPVQYAAPVQAKQPAGRFAPLNPVATSYSRRWVFPAEYDLPQLVDAFDELQTIVDPKSALVQNAAMAIGRAYDDAILAAATATAKVGQDAASLSDETFSTANYQIAVNFKASANTGLTISKILEVRRKFRHAHVDIDAEPITLVIGSQQETDLLSQQQVVSKEYNDTPVLVNGRLQRFLGCDIVVMERVPETTAGSVRGCLAFVKSGIHLGIWEDMNTRISQRIDLSSQPWQAYTKAMFGATRLQPGKVLQVLCADTTGGDVTP